jgi:DHA1 family bicyclomycin/chloramphenicol resistance-like MFS transporter
MSEPKPNRIRGRVIDSGDQLSKKLLLSYIVILALSMSLVPFSIDPFLPAFPEIATYFGVTNGTVQASLTGVTVGLALGQLIIGPLSDAFGRRPLILLATVGFGLSAVTAFFAPNFETFLVLRFAMGFFAAGADVVSRAIVRDLYRGQRMQTMLAKIFLIQSLSPIIGPIVGAQVTQSGNWQAIFLIFGIVGIVLALFSSGFLVETLPVAKRRSSTPLGLARGYLAVLKDRVYIGLLIFGAFQISALFTYVNNVPFLFQDSFGLSPGDFGFWFAANSLAAYIGVQIGAYAARHIKGQWLLAIYSSIGVCVGAGLFLTAGSGLVVAEAFFMLQLFIFGAGITTIPTIALYNHGSEAGTAASLLGVVNFATASLVSIVYGFMNTQDTRDVGLLIVLLFVVSLSSLMLITRPRKVPDLRTGS